jgi:hypothetical protein
VSQKRETVKRFDRVALPATKVIRTDEGFIRAPARLTRAGLFTYRNPITGDTWRELRLPEEVFKADSLATLDLLPLTMTHPRPTGSGDPLDGAVTAKNAQRLTVGSVGKIRRDEADPNYVAGEVLITDGGAVVSVENGDRELSCGYFCEREPAAPGATYKDPVTGDVSDYRFVQRNIQYNHVAIVPVGRAGPDAKIILDHNDAIELAPGDPADSKKGTPTMKKKIVIDGVSFEVEENVAQAFEKYEATRNKSIDTLTARADSADGQVKKLTADLAVAADPKRFEAAVASRLSLASVASKHEIKIDGLDDMAIRRATLAKIAPSLKLDGKSDDYVVAAFEIETSRNPVNAQLGALPAAPAVPGATGPTTDAAPGSHRAAHVTGFFGHDATKRTDASTK